MSRLFSDEQLERACNIDLVEMLRGQGESLKKQGRVYRWVRYDSTVIYGNKWYRHSCEVGGGRFSLCSTSMAWILSARLSIC